MSIKILKNEIKSELDKNPKYREMLFRRGYLLTDNKLNCLDDYPFYGVWSENQIDKYFLYVQHEQTVYKKTIGNLTSVIIGHAYNPFDMKYKEEDLCGDLIESYSNGIESYFDKIVDIIVNVDRVKEVMTKKQDKMLFITGSDELKVIDIVLFPKVYQIYNNINKDDILLIRGKVEKRFDSYQIVANKIEKLN